MLLTIATLIVGILALPGVLQLFATPNIDKVKIFIDGDQVAESSVDNEPIDLAQLPTQYGGESVVLKVVLVDENNMTHVDNDLRCRWDVAPIDDVSEDINTEACEVLYIPSQNHSKQKVVVEVEGVERQFKPIPFISMEFGIIN